MSDPNDERGEPVRLEVRIEAPRARVWRALAEDISAWWPAASFNVGGASARMTLEPRVGGRMFEDWGEGQGLLWAHVCTVRRPELLQMVSDAFPEWGGPLRSYLTWRLESDGEATIVRFVDAALGERRPGDDAEKEKGWRFLMAGCLKAHLEGRPLPAWEE
jgi:uncharacterized protein YndB with AHSA1/START domain